MLLRSRFRLKQGIQRREIGFHDSAVGVTVVLQAEQMTWRIRERDIMSGQWNAIAVGEEMGVLFVRQVIKERMSEIVEGRAAVHCQTSYRSLRHHSAEALIQPM